jgi:hypothetical protein
MSIEVGPTGQTIEGHLLDVNVKAFNEALRAYDPLLYTKWNPRKLNGWGCWEIRRKPTYKRIVDYTISKKLAIFKLEYVENEVINHVLDCAFLNYDAIRKLKEMDTWNKNHWIHDLEYREAKQRERLEEDAREALKYNLKQIKSATRELKNLVASGQNLDRIMSGIDWTKSSN